MKKTTVWAWVALPVLALSSASWAQTTALKVNDAKVQIKGDSTLHGWEVNALTVTVNAEAALKDGALLDQVKAGALKSLALVVPVDGLQSTESKGMDKNIHGDLGEDKTPNITFNMARYSVDGLTVTAQGSLSINGVAKNVTLTGALSATANGLAVNGSYGLKISDYAVKVAPVMFMRVKDDVTILYSFNLSK
jgi:polyisoprenoid-binding protein YceI